MILRTGEGLGIDVRYGGDGDTVRLVLIGPMISSNWRAQGRRCIGSGNAKLTAIFLW